MAFQILSYLQIVSKDSSLPPQRGGHDRELSPLVDGITGLKHRRDLLNTTQLLMVTLATLHFSHGALSHVSLMSPYDYLIFLGLIIFLYVSLSLLLHLLHLLAASTIYPFAAPFISPCRSQQRRKISHLTRLSC